jgi:predicted 3-demethylubiquinone-9 3-methyltransferase (glyoxalase superfamily)
MSKIAPRLWFNGEAAEAAKFYVSLVKLDIAGLQHACDGA